MNNFTPATNDKYAEKERKRAETKNHNIPILNYLHNGHKDKEIKCAMSGSPAFINTRSVTRNCKVKNFRLDFDHIRQYETTSTDKTISPSDIFRSFKLDDPQNADRLVEMMCCWPLSTEWHSYKSNDAKHGNIVLTDYPKKIWPWFLKNKKNFDKVCKRFRLNLNYKKFINALSDVHFPCIPKNYIMLNNHNKLKKGSKK